MAGVTEEKVGMDPRLVGGFGLERYVATLNIDLVCHRIARRHICLLTLLILARMRLSDKGKGITRMPLNSPFLGSTDWRTLELDAEP